MKSGGKRLLHILYFIFGINYLPTCHSGSSVAHSSFGVAKPFNSLSRIPGMLTKYKVSWIERQSSSATITTFPFFPVTQTGSLLSIASSMSRKKFFLAVVAFVIDIANTTRTLLCTSSMPRNIKYVNPAKTAYALSCWKTNWRNFSVV